MKARLILAIAILVSFLAVACSHPAASQFDSSRYSGRVEKVTLEIPTIA
ncbi:MAG: hypothetical protein HY645_07240 [Acidobacteria bacterium]|nr:hypothetical protein [Acidobacteriota bacterium]